MNKKLLLNSICFSIIALLLLGSVPASAKALPHTKIKESKILKVTTDYLNAIVNKDLDTILDLSKSEMDLNEDIRKDDVLTGLNNPNTSLKSFKIISVSTTDESDTYNVICNLTYNNQSIIQETFNVRSNDLETYVYLKDMGITATKVIKEGIDIPVISPRVMLTSWNVEILASTGTSVAYSSKFSASTDYVELNYKQSASMKYTVVLPTWAGYSNVSWTATTNPNWTTGPNSVVLNKIPGKSFQNCRLRIEISTASQGFSFGEVYAYY